MNIENKDVFISLPNEADRYLRNGTWGEFTKVFTDVISPFKLFDYEVNPVHHITEIVTYNCNKFPAVIRYYRDCIYCLKKINSTYYDNKGVQYKRNVTIEVAWPRHVGELTHERAGYCKILEIDVYYDSITGRDRRVDKLRRSVTVTSPIVGTYVEIMRNHVPEKKCIPTTFTVSDHYREYMRMVDLYYDIFEYMDVKDDYIFNTNEFVAVMNRMVFTATENPYKGGTPEYERMRVIRDAVFSNKPNKADIIWRAGFVSLSKSFDGYGNNKFIRDHVRKYMVEKELIKCLREARGWNSHVPSRPSYPNHDKPIKNTNAGNIVQVHLMYTGCDSVDICLNCICRDNYMYDETYNDEFTIQESRESWDFKEPKPKRVIHIIWR